MEEKLIFGKQKHLFMCNFGILSQGNTLTISGNLTDFN